MRSSSVVMSAAAALACFLLSGTASVAAHNPHCVRWRATGRCDPHGVREAHNDATCDKTIASGLSGYCECEDRRRVREVTCDHHEFICKDACAEDSSAELTCTSLRERPSLDCSSHGMANVVCNCDIIDPTGFEYVTCGSSIKLVHEPSRFRLHSHEIAYGGGSGQQSITAHGSRNDRNSYWLVKEGDGEAGCSIGTYQHDVFAINCRLLDTTY